MLSEAWIGGLFLHLKIQRALEGILLFSLLKQYRELVPHVICFSIFAKPKHTGLFVLERRGASGKDGIKALFSSLAGCGSSVYGFRPAVRAASTRV